MTTSPIKAKGVSALWYEQDPALLAENARFHIRTQEAHLLELQQRLANLDGDGWVRKPYQIKAPTEREELQHDIYAAEKRLFRARDFADAYTRISLRGGTSPEITDEIKKMKAEGVLRRHPIDLQVEQFMEKEYGTQPNNDWFHEYDPKFTG